MKQISFFRMLDLSEVATTARDLTPLLRAFREYDGEALKVVEARWTEIAKDLERVPADQDVVVLVSDGAHLILPRANAVSLTLSLDVRISDSLSRERSKRPAFDFVVEAAGRATILQLEHEHEEPSVPQIDWSRCFTLWNIKRERDAHYVFLETGEAVVTWFNLASLVGCSEDELSQRAGPVARSLAVTARHGDAKVLCVRIDFVETFLNEVEQ